MPGTRAEKSFAIRPASVTFGVRPKMKSRSPLLNRSGYLLDTQELRLLQKGGWLSLPLAEIAAVKKPSFASAVVRFTDGRKKSLDLSHLSTEAFSAVIDVLKKAVHDHRAASARSK